MVLMVISICAVPQFAWFYCIFIHVKKQGQNRFGKIRHAFITHMVEENFENFRIKIADLMAPIRKEM